MFQTQAQGVIVKLHTRSFLSAFVLSSVAFGAHAVDFTFLPSYVGVINSGSVSGNAGSAAPGFGTGSWQLSGIDKSQVYWDATALFGGAVTVGQLEKISFWTNKPGDSTQPDWTLTIYTKPGASGNSAISYQSKLNSEPYFTSLLAQPSKPGGQWNKWSTDGADPLRFYDNPRTGHFGANDDPTLADLTSGSVTFDPTTTPVSRDYRYEEILYFSLGTGSAWSSTFTGLVDGLSITARGATVNLDLEAVAAIPEPETYALMLAGLAVVGAAARRRKAK
jgi:hypothetical protein